MYNIFRKKTLWGEVQSKAREQFPGFLVSTGFVLSGLVVRAVAVEVVKKATEQKKAPLQQSQP